MGASDSASVSRVKMVPYGSDTYKKVPGHKNFLNFDIFDSA
jgi:hypothetical protein